MKKKSISKKAYPELQQRIKNELSTLKTSVPLEPVTNIKHSVNLGDLVSLMGALKRYYDATKRKLSVFQQIGTIAAYYQGATHPTVNEEGVNVCINLKMWEMVKPLIESQDYIHSFEKYEGQKIDLDFDVIRGKTFVNLPHGMIQNWVVYAFPDLAFNVAEPWMKIEGKTPRNIEKQIKGKILVNFTERYRNTHMDYFYLKNYSDDLVFSGTEREHWLFCNAWQLNIPRLEHTDFLELGYAVRDARFTISNQSFLWNLCEAMKKPRMLELCSYAANCQNGVGESSFGYYHQVGNEYYFRRLFNETVNK